MSQHPEADLKAELWYALREELIRELAKETVRWQVVEMIRKDRLTEIADLARMIETNTPISFYTRYGYISGDLNSTWRYPIHNPAIILLRERP
jgi:hypothetical protein